jgi:hypothetical protein
MRRDPPRQVFSRAEPDPYGRPIGFVNLGGLLSCLVLCGVLSPALGAQASLRQTYQRVIDRHYPGFRIIPASNLDSPARVRDGVRGSLVVGRFDFDRTTDFAAFVIPSNSSRHEAGPNSYDYYAGKLVMCFGAAGGAHRCEALERPFTLPYDSHLQIIARGRYQCFGSAPAVTTIASVGEASEKGGGLYVRNADGSVRLCITAD